MRLKRSATIASYWLGDRLVFDNYRTGARVTADPRTLTVLDFFSTWRSEQDFYAYLPDYDRGSLRRTLHQLRENTLLYRQGSPDERKEKTFLRQWSEWLPHAGLFHFGTKDVKYATHERGIKKYLRKLLADSPQPSFFKRYQRNAKLALPPVSPPADLFLAVLLRRRTHRRFSSEPLTRQELSQLLQYTWGITGYIEEPILGRLPVKTSPSGGARHPGEVYVLVRRVRGVSPGLYHYAPDRHRLIRLAGKADKRIATAYCAGQSWFGDAAALFLMTAVFAREMWKYPVPRAYRVLTADAGHLCQTFCLVATWLGLAPFCTMAFNDSLIERDLGIDGIGESMLYLAGVGKPAPGGTAPIDFIRRFASA